MLFFAEEKIDRLLWEIKPTIHRATYPIPRFKFYEGDCFGAEHPQFDDSWWADFNVGEYWGGYDVTAWFRATVPIPAELCDKKVALRFLVGPRDGGASTAETMLYVNGEPLQAIDIWHEEAWLPPEYLHGDPIQIALKAWSGVLGVPDRRRFTVADLLWIDEGAEGFYALAENVSRAIKELDANDWRRVRLLEALNESIARIDFTKARSERYCNSIENAWRCLQAELDRLGQTEDGKPTVIGVGHAHIDLAWLWRLNHTREKAARTFTTALHLMRQYPEYRFIHSTPQLYQYVERDNPALFARIKRKIRLGEWEITGGMWIEPDTNLPSGESLVRQILFGKRYMRDQFDVDTTTLWLPDVFGYSGALPQIMRKSGLKYFMTTKISWNQFNRFPYDTFHWRGIDGSEVLTHFVTTPENESWQATYNGTLHPHEVKRLWDNYQQKAINGELLATFGWGDGGGGPTKEMLDSARVMKNLPGIPKVEIGKVEPFFARLEKRLADKDVPVWDGELYLEYHRGTYTSQAYNKRANRQSEILYHDAEWLGALATILTGNDYPNLREGWELILLNQFHDILPGSSIRQVYEDSAEDYAHIAEIGTVALDQARQAICAQIGTEQPGVVVFNALAWQRGGLIELDDTGYTLADEHGQPLLSQLTESDKLLVEVPHVPALGYQMYPLIPCIATDTDMVITPTRLENGHYRITLNQHGQIESLYDKANRREVLASGVVGNVFQAFQDKPLKFDAWDIDPFYAERMQPITDLVEAQVEETGPLRGTLRLQWRFYDSTITQRITLYKDSPRIDFRTEVDWHEQQILLKIAFPVSIRATRATYDIQFGNIERPTHRNTSWDLARFESVAHKWVDLSEGNYGVALLNDCKYGHDVKDNVLRLTLIKSAITPDEQADQGRHVFTYSLLPHAGDWRASQVVQEAYALNMPLHVGIIRAPQTGALPQSYGFAVIDVDNVVLETVKKSEDDDSWIVRVYECKQYRSGAVNIAFGQPIKRAVECNLVEEGAEPVAYDGRCLTFAIAPYEIKTFKVWFNCHP
ncbi:MAG: alpha-mannosidase [Anaerolineae bacterium]|nr:alpha-mannosidase [Anaerolineae bacterium]